MPKSIDLNAIAEEISLRKKERKQTAEKTGVDIPQSKDEFLHELMASVYQGTPTKAATKVQVINERAQKIIRDKNTGQLVNKNTAPVNEEVLRHLNAPQYNESSNVNPNVNPNYNNGRDEEMWKNVEEANKILASKYNGNGTPNQTLAESISQYKNMQYTGNQTGLMNPQLLVEQVNNAVQTYLASDNFYNIIEIALKSTMMEIYAKEKVEKALNENKDMIQKMVIDTIISLKKKELNKQTVK